MTTRLLGFVIEFTFYPRKTLHFYEASPTQTSLTHDARDEGVKVEFEDAVRFVRNGERSRGKP